MGVEDVGQVSSSWFSMGKFHMLLHVALPAKNVFLTMVKF